MNITFSDNYAGVYSLTHIVYLLIFVAMCALEIFFLKKFVRGSGKEKIVIRIIGILHLIIILVNRFINTYFHVEFDHTPGYTWLTYFPFTFCALSSLCFSILEIVGKKDLPYWHFFFYFGLFGGIVTMIYPDFMETQSTWDLRTFTGFFHHMFIIFGAIAIFVLDYFKPSHKKWYYYPLGYMMVMVLGLLEMDLFKFPDAMNIHKPLLASAPILTSWYMVLIVSTIFVFFFTLIFDGFANKKRVEETRDE